jgi:hypothetical protein
VYNTINYECALNENPGVLEGRERFLNENEFIGGYKNSCLNFVVKTRRFEFERRAGDLAGGLSLQHPQGDESLRKAMFRVDQTPEDFILAGSGSQKEDEPDIHNRENGLGRNQWQEKSQKKN